MARSLKHADPALAAHPCFQRLALLLDGALVAVTLGLLLDSPEVLDAFVLVGIDAGFAILGLIAQVWYLFDTNLAKPIETPAAAFRSAFCPNRAIRSCRSPPSASSTAAG